MDSSLLELFLRSLGQACRVPELRLHELRSLHARQGGAKAHAPDKGEQPRPQADGDLGHALVEVDGVEIFRIDR